MTTIAVNRKMMASDRQVGHGDAKFFSKKISKHKCIIVGSAGHCGNCDALINWIKFGKDKPDDVDDVDVIVLSKDGILIYSDSVIPMIIVDEFYAIGTGAQAALAAMHMGADPKEAVLIAKKVDPCTGGQVDLINLK